MTTDAERPREALLLFAQQLELDACADTLRGLTHARFRTERVGTNPREARARTHHLVATDPPPAAVLLLGSAAWLLPRTQIPNDPIWVRELRSESGPTLRPSLRISASDLGSLGLLSLRLVTTQRPVQDSERASELAKLGAEVVDQVAYGVLHGCIEGEVECAVLLAARGYAIPNGMPSDRSSLEGTMRRLSLGVAPLLQWIDRREARRLGRKRG